MMPEVTQAIEASGVMFGGQQDRKAAIKLSTEFGSLCIHARDVIKDSIAAV